jgi:hypothetical protein
MTKTPHNPADFDLVLSDFLSWLKNIKVEGIIIGGIAVSLLGNPRTTQDIDALIKLHRSKWEMFLERGKNFGFTSRVTDPIEFCLKSKVLLLRHKCGISIDVSIALLPFEIEAIDNRDLKKLGRHVIPLPRPEDLVIMKAVAHRPQDFPDIESILIATPKINLKRIRKILREFGSVLEIPEILEDFDKIAKRIK